MKFLIIAFLFLSTPFVYAVPLINFYVDETGNADAVGISKEKVLLPEGIFYENEKIFGSTQKLTSKNQEVWEFNFSTDKKMQIQVYLPEDSTIHSVSEETVIYTEKNQIILSAYSDGIYFKYKFSKKNSYFVYYLVFFFLLILVLALVAYYLLLKIKRGKKTSASKKFDKFRILNDVLNEREKMILKKLKECKKNNVKIKQNQIRKSLDIPKASFSRHLHELERKSLIRRIGEGKNKFIELR